MFEGFKQHQINVGAVEIACVIAGEGEPVLMLPGFPHTMVVWAQMHLRGLRKAIGSFARICAEIWCFEQARGP